jgi:hypothetical protein
MPGKLRLSPFELMYGRPLPCLGDFPADLYLIGDKTIVKQLQTLGTTLRDLQKYTIERTPIPLGDPLHPFQAGDSVWVKDWEKEPLKPQRTGPHMIILTTLTGLKVAGNYSLGPSLQSKEGL